MALPLFGSQQAAKPTKNLIEFKAGKMTQKGKMVHPDTRKGQIYIYKSDDSLTHFCWKNRTTGEVVDDLIIFPEDADFSRVKQCTTGRVYIMKFRSSNRRFFCWMQEPSEDKDDDTCKKVNEILNGTAPTEDAPATPTATQKTAQEMLNTLGNIDQSQLMDMFGPMPGRTATNGAGGQNPVSVAALQNILSGLPTNGTPAPAPADTAPDNEVTPANIISKDAIDELLKCPETVAKLEEHLPEGLRGDKETLRKTLLSPQFQQALQLFSSAFKSGQLAPLMKSLGFADAAGNAAAGGNFEAFVKAAQTAANEKKKDEAEDDMALD